MDYAALIHAIDRAFDGVPAPGAGQRTLDEAQAEDNRRADDPSTHPPPHRGRWQDLPFAELDRCDEALPHLNPDGVHYYVPAILTRMMHWLESDCKTGYLFSFEGVEFFLSASSGYDLREHKRNYLGSFSAAQRRVIRDCLRVSATHNPEYVEPWDRAVAHDESGEDGHWFDAFWPAWDRPTASDVIAQILAAFPEADNPELRPPRKRIPYRLDTTTAAEFVQIFRAHALTVLRDPGSLLAGATLKDIERAIRPLWGHPDHPQIRARLTPLTQDMRRAISSFANARIEDPAARQAWQRAAEHAGPDWFDSLRAD